MYPIVKSNGSHSLLTHNNTTVMRYHKYSIWAKVLATWVDMMANIK